VKALILKSDREKIPFDLTKIAELLDEANICLNHFVQHTHLYTTFSSIYHAMRATYYRILDNRYGSILDYILLYL
jgi:hypothetical protein